MELALVCNCGTKRVWTGRTFTEIRAQVERDGWDINLPTCLEHTTTETPPPSVQEDR